MFNFDNTHIFTGYLKQLLSTFNLPSCKIYSKEFIDYRLEHGKEDPRVIESFDTVSPARHAVRINYLKGNEVYNYFASIKNGNPDFANASWRKTSTAFYSSDIHTHGLTKTLHSPGNTYDTATHEYLGEYLRFIRDFYGVNLMSMYNCFNNRICNDVFYTVKNGFKAVKTKDADGNEIITNEATWTTFDSLDRRYKIYAIPVKLFYDYTIAVDCMQPIEMFCGFYKTKVDASVKAEDFACKTYCKINRAQFRCPVLYDKLNVKNWSADNALIKDSKGNAALTNSEIITRYDIANRELDLKLFIKVPTSCRSSIVVLEGDYRGFNDFIFKPEKAGSGVTWKYKRNHTVINFDKDIDHNNSNIKLIHKLQLLELNTGESHPFSDRLIEYLCNSTITPIDRIPENIKRAQNVMNGNKYFFKIPGIWENKMQKIVYDYIMNSGPIELIDVNTDGTSVNEDSTTIKIADTDNHKAYFKFKNTNKQKILVDKRRGYHTRLGHSSQSSLYDILGYVDKEAEKWYAIWKSDGDRAIVKDSIQNTDIYKDKNGKGLYDF